MPHPKPSESALRALEELRIQLESSNLTVGQKAMKAVRLGRQYVGLSQSVMAAALGISRSSISMTEIVLDRGTPDEIEACEVAQAAASSVARRIMKGMTSVRRSKEKAKTPAERLNTPENMQQRAIEVAVFANLRTALHSIMNLPSPVDVVRIVKANRQREALVNSSFDAAFQWLVNFSKELDANGKRDADKDRKNRSGSCVADAGDGGAASGAQHT